VGKHQRRCLPQLLVNGLQPLDQRRVGHAARFAHRLQAEAAAAFFARRDEIGEEAAARSADGVAERNGAARLTLSVSAPVFRSHASTTEANASLTSKASMWSMESPARASNLWVAGMIAVNIRMRSSPIGAKCAARGMRPSRARVYGSPRQSGPAFHGRIRISSRSFRHHRTD
jgi:hypothetical protein